MRWAPYVPVAKRREKAEKQVKKLAKNGKAITPIEIQGRTIAHTFWGKAWCTHMESFCDHDNRLPRGRTYVRNGSVCHLEINEGEVKAIVSGSYLYNVKIAIKSLTDEKWQAIKKTCTGKISSLLDLLSGKLTTGVMDIVCNKNKGLFPLSNEFNLACDCPDWATMCKHVAAVLYGIGARLDADPAQLFKLRGVNFEELIDVNQAVLEVTSTGQGKRKRLDESAFDNIFNFETSELPPVEKESVPVLKPVASFPKKLTGNAIAKKRKALKFTKNEFAKKVGVSVTSITLWEAKEKEAITLSVASLNKLKKLWNEV
jgi:uncharacterized Zn finger protein